MSLSLIVYDLDGTLIDSASNIAAATNRARVREGLGALPLQEVLPCIGHGSRHLIWKALFESGELPEDRFEAVYARFMHDYLEHPADDVPFYPGVLEALRYFQGRVPQAILTNKPHKVTLEVCRRLELNDYFETVQGPDETVAPKPDPTALLAIIEQLGADPARTWMVGDGVPDVEVAHAAATNSLAILGGFYPPERVMSLEPGPTVAVESFRDAFDYLRSLA